MAASDASGNARAEAVNGYYSAELFVELENPGHCETIEKREIAIFEWRHWSNQESVQGSIGEALPADFKTILSGSA